MRKRLSKSQRRAEILTKAAQLFADGGYDQTEMEDIRLACGMSRGGLYHHFPNKRAVLTALIEDDVMAMAKVLHDPDTPAIPALIRAGSVHLGSGSLLVSCLQSVEDKQDYLSGLEQAFATLLFDPLCDRMATCVRDGVTASHATELFLCVNAHINRNEILGRWTPPEAAGFAVTALGALSALMKDPAHLHPVIRDLQDAAAQR